MITMPVVQQTQEGWSKALEYLQRWIRLAGKSADGRPLAKQPRYFIR
jgi:hypothetical protein